MENGEFYFETLRMIVPGSPVAWHRPGRNKFTGSTYLHPKDREFQRKVKIASVLCRPPITPTGPVAVKVTSFLHRPKNKKIGIFFPHIVTPDDDNLLKNVKDAMQGSMYAKDNQVIHSRVTKLYTTGEPSDYPRTVIEIYFLHNLNENAVKKYFDKSIFS